MKNSTAPDILITGVGVTSACGVGKDAFLAGLLAAKNSYGVMQRPGRQRGSQFLGAELAALDAQGLTCMQGIRRASFAAQVAALTLHEAWRDARLDSVDPARIGLVIGGSNLQQRDLVQAVEAHGSRPQYMRPTYALTFMDTDVCGICTQAFGIRGAASTVGGASASGHIAVVHAMQALRDGQVDFCIAVGGLMDVSYLECHAFRSIGAMGSDRYADAPALACRPFDRQRDGFIYGEACGAIVLERATSAGRDGVTPYARVSGHSVVMDGNRNPDPSYDGEVRAIRTALSQARIDAAHIEYVNPHGSGSVVGDETELRALACCGLTHAWINATKSITGHGLSAAGALEIVATVLQMRAGVLHPTRNLEEPIDPGFNWVSAQPVAVKVRRALNLSFGFGGINSAICLEGL